MINYSASYDVHIGLLLFLTSLCWNRHSEDSKKVRHLKIGPLVQKLQMIPHFWYALVQAYTFWVEPFSLESIYRLCVLEWGEVSDRLGRIIPI